MNQDSIAQLVIKAAIVTTPENKNTVELYLQEVGLEILDKLSGEDKIFFFVKGNKEAIEQTRSNSLITDIQYPKFFKIGNP